jgi:transposase
VEACCGASDLADELVEELQWSVSLAHPGYVARIKQSPDKTDFNDARLLADLLRVGYLPKVWLAPEHVRELRRLVRYRQQLVDQRRDSKLRVSALLREQRLRCPHANTWTVAWRQWLLHQAGLSEQSRWIIERHLQALKQLQADIREVETRLAEACGNDAVVNRLIEQPGIGFVTAVTLRAEIGRFDRFGSGKQLSRFCGLSPRNASSGQRQADAGLIKAGRPQLRAVLIEAAHRLIRYEKRWARLANRLRRAGKPGSVTAAAVANRWMRWLYHQVQPAALAA